MSDHIDRINVHSESPNVLYRTGRVKVRRTCDGEWSVQHVCGYQDSLMFHYTAMQIADYHMRHGCVLLGKQYWSDPSEERRGVYENTPVPWSLETLRRKEWRDRQDREYRDYCERGGWF